jgi:O-antigen/teichoic acid export membrane protein
MAISLWAACFLLPPTAALTLQGSILQGYRKVSQSQAPRLVVRPALFGLGVATTVLVIGHDLDAADAILLNALATILALSLTWLWARGSTPAGISRTDGERDAKLWITTALGLLWMAASQLILSQQIDVLVVGTYLTTTDAGIYGVASQLSMLLGVASLAVVYVACPYIPDLHAQGRRSELQSLVRWNVLVGTGIGIVGLAGMLVLGRYMLGWFGSEFAPGYSTLIILSVGQAAGASFGSLAGVLLTMTGYHNRAGVITVIAAVGNLVLTIILTPMLGIVGAALATVLVLLGKILAFAISVRRHLGINVFALLATASE